MGICDLKNKLVFIVIILSVGIITCNNPFSTRKPETPSGSTGVAIKPASSPENVLWNLRASFESMSIQDYLDIFSEDYVFNPDYDDSLRYEVVFRNGWGFMEEKTYAENFLQTRFISEIDVYPTFEYKPGEDMYDYKYSIKIFPADSTQVMTDEKTDVKGHAWLYLKENDQGQWKIYKWVEIANMIEGSFITWGVLRALNAGF